jgi:hypothetical protein
VILGVPESRFVTSTTQQNSGGVVVFVVFLYSGRWGDRLTLDRSQPAALEARRLL